MASLRLPRIGGWGNLQGPYEVLSSYRRHIVWTSPFFPRRVHNDVPDKLWFLVRPRSLTRFLALPVGRVGHRSTIIPGMESNSLMTGITGRRLECSRTPD
jgi:hypothetical protein